MEHLGSRRGEEWWQSSAVFVSFWSQLRMGTANARAMPRVFGATNHFYSHGDPIISFSEWKPKDRLKYALAMIYSMGFLKSFIAILHGLLEVYWIFNPSCFIQRSHARACCECINPSQECIVVPIEVILSGVENNRWLKLQKQTAIQSNMCWSLQLGFLHFQF